MIKSSINKFRQDITKNKYLSDGAYVALGSGCVVLYSTDEVELQNEIYLDNVAMDALITWYKELNGVETL